MEDLAKHRISTNPISTYNGVGHSPMSVTLDVFAYLGDQPERRGLNYLMLGKSTHHARWRFSCNMSLLIPILRACSNCEKRLHDSLYNCTFNHEYLFSQCNNCTNWWLHQNDPLLVYNAPTKFPPGFTLGGNPRTSTDGIPPGMLRPIELTYAILCKVSTMAHGMVVGRQ